MIFIQYENSTTVIMRFRFNNDKSSLGSITEKYADVYIHLGEKNCQNSVVKANKVILGMRSPYFHRIFQSRENIQVVDMCFVGVPGSMIRDAINLMYGGTIEILDDHVKRFSGFLELLELDVNMTNIEEGENKVKSFKTKSTAIENEANKRKRQEEVTEEGDKEISKNIYSEVPSSSPHEIYSSSTKEVPSFSQTKQTEVRFMTPAMPTKDYPLPKSTVREIFKESSSSSSKHRTTSDICSDNWTETSTTGLVEELKNLDFEIGKSTKKGVGHKEYICCNCGLIVKDIFSARNHYIQVHQNSDKEEKIIMEVIKYQKKAIEEVKSLEVDISGDCNKTLAIIELENINENLQERLVSLSQLNDKNLPPNLTRKRDHLTKSISALSAKLQAFIIKL